MTTNVKQGSKEIKEIRQKKRYMTRKQLKENYGKIL